MGKHSVNEYEEYCLIHIRIIKDPVLKYSVKTKELKNNNDTEEKQKKTIAKDENGENNTDVVPEMDYFLDCRYVSAYEIMQRFFKFKIPHQRVPITRSSIHLPLEHQIIVQDNDSLQKLVFNTE
ncbi:hypothetical protein YC2023_118811 [Brassica napus]